METDLLVVGGGPSGSFFASLVAKDARTVVLEEHPVVGKPVQCTGLVAPRVVEMAGAAEAVLNELNAVTFHFPGGGTVEVEGRETKAVVLDRSRFDQICRRRAEERGAEFRLSERFVGLTRERGTLRVRTRAGDHSGSHAAKIIVGADGYKAAVAKSVGIEKPRDNVRGIQVDLGARSQDQQRVDVYLGKDVAPGFFAWKVPCGDFTRVGLCASRGHPAPSTYLSKLVRSLGLEDAETLSTVSGLIPLGTPGRTYADGALLIGDACAQAKPLSGGGIYTGMVAAKCAAETALEALEANDVSSRYLARYQARWKELIGREVERGFLLRKAYVRMPDSKLDDLCETLNRPEVLSILSEGDIDFPTALAPSLLRAAPSLIKFAPQFLRSVFWRA